MTRGIELAVERGFIVSNGKRQQRRVALRVGQVKAAAEHVREFVVQRHGAGAERNPAEPRALQRVVPRRAAVRPFEFRHGADQLPNAFGRDVFDNRVGIDSVERLDRVGDGVEAAGDAQRYRHGVGQVRVVDRHLWLDFRPALGLLLAIDGLAEDVCHLRAGIGRRHADLRQPGAQRQGLTQADRRTAANRNKPVNPVFTAPGERIFGHLKRRVHGRGIQMPRAQRRTQLPRDFLPRCPLLRGGQHRHAGQAEALDLLAQYRQLATPEDDAGGQALEDETVHRPAPSADRRVGSGRRR